MKRCMLLVLLVIVLSSCLVIAQETTDKEKIQTKKTTTLVWDVYPDGSKVLVNMTIEEEVTQYDVSQTSISDELVQYLMAFMGFEDYAEESGEDTSTTVIEEDSEDDETQETAEEALDEYEEGVDEAPEANTTELVDCSDDTYSDVDEPNWFEDFLDELSGQEEYARPDVPEGYDIMVDSFTINCDELEENYFQVSIDSKYTDVQAIRCRQGICQSISGEDISDLECPVDAELFEFEAEFVSIEKLEKTFTEEDNVLEESGVTFEYEGTSESTLTVSTPEEIYQPNLPDSEFISIPIEVQLDSSDDDFFKITVPYNEILAENKYVNAYMEVDGEYYPLVSEEENGAYVINVDLNEYLDKDETGHLELVGTLCSGCFEPMLERKFMPDPESREAIVFVHGLFGVDESWQVMMDDYMLTNQPYQIWTYEYPTDVSYKESGQDLAMQLEAESEEFDKIYFVGHSMGGLVSRNALYYGYENEYNFIDKTQMLIMMGTPNKGSPVANLSLELLQGIKIDNPLLTLSPDSVEQLREAEDIPRVPGIKYYAIAGTKSLADEEIVWPIFGDEPNDGLVTLSSALYVGDASLTEECSEYWTVYQEHELLHDDESARTIVEMLINKYTKKANPEENVAGFSEYYKMSIDSCIEEDTYFIIGKLLSDEEMQEEVQEELSPFLCSCSNGVCTGIEIYDNCPEDCPKMKTWWIWVLFGILCVVVVGGILGVIYRNKIYEFILTKF